MLGTDDTLARKRGLKIFGAGMHHDRLRFTRSRPVTSWGLSWVTLGMIKRLPFRPDHSYYLPLLLRLYQNNSAAAKSRRAYRSRPELAVELLHLLCNQRKSNRFHVVGDSAYGGQSVLCNLPENCDITSRLLPKARLYGPPPAPEKGRMGKSPPIACGDAQGPLPSCHTRHLRQVSEGTSRRLRHQGVRRAGSPAARRGNRGHRGEVKVFYSTCADATAD